MTFASNDDIRRCYVQTINLLLLLRVLTTMTSQECCYVLLFVIIKVYTRINVIYSISKVDDDGWIPFVWAGAAALFATTIDEMGKKIWMKNRVRASAVSRPSPYRPMNVVRGPVVMVPHRGFAVPFRTTPHQQTVSLP